MKARVWTAKNKRFRIVERFEKVTAASLFDVQIKKHHFWVNHESGLSQTQIATTYGLKIEGKPELEEKEAE